MKEFSVFSNRTHVWVAAVEDGVAGETLCAVERAPMGDEYRAREELALALERTARHLRMSTAKQVLHDGVGPSVRLDDVVKPEAVRK